MILIVGLGNPGKKYEKTRHNVGFMIIDEIARNFQFPTFNFQKKFNAQISERKIADRKIILAKPQTFMNNSGQTVKSLIKELINKNNKRNTSAMAEVLRQSLWVIHDDIDLPLGKIKIVKNRGSAGHKGVESIIKELKTKNFVRFRIGICPKTDKPKNPEKFVLQKFNKGEEKIVKEVIKKTSAAVEFSLKDYNPPTVSSPSPKGERVPFLEKAMQKFNK